MSSLSNVVSDAALSTVEDDSTGPEYIVDSGVYDAVIDMAYIMKSQSSNAMGLNIKFKTREGTMINERVWFTNRNGQTYYTRDGQNVALPGFNQLNALSTLVTGKGFLDLADAIEEKQVMIYNRDEQKEVPTNAEVVVPFIGRKVKLGVIRQYEDVGDANNNWQPTGYSRETNTVDKFFDADTGQSQGEKIEGKEASFIEKWKAKNQGITRDRTANKVGLNPKPRNGAAATNLVSNNGQAAPAGKPAQSLFNDGAAQPAAAATTVVDDDIPF